MRCTRLLAVIHERQSRRRIGCLGVRFPTVRGPAIRAVPKQDHHPDERDNAEENPPAAATDILHTADRDGEAGHECNKHAAEFADERPEVRLAEQRAGDSDDDVCVDDEEHAEELEPPEFPSPGATAKVRSKTERTKRPTPWCSCSFEELRNSIVATSFGGAATE